MAAITLGVLAAAGWWVHATTQIQYAVNDFARISAFGGRVTLAPGTHTFWIEGDCLSCTGNEPSEYRRAATVEVVDPAGNELALRPAPDRVYNTGGLEGRALWLFDVVSPGQHRLRLSFDTSGDWDNNVPGRIAVGQGVGLPVRVVRPMAAMIVGGLVSGSAWAVAVHRRRDRWFRSQSLAVRPSPSPR